MGSRCRISSDARRRLDNFQLDGNGNFKRDNVAAVKQNLDAFTFSQELGARTHDLLIDTHLIVGFLVHEHESRTVVVQVLEVLRLHPDDVKGFLRGRMASYKIPRRVLFFDEAELSLTGNAKIRTEQLRALAAARMP